MQNFKVFKMLMGFTIIVFGTSVPEFAVSMQSLARGNTDLLLGKIIGSNFFNACVVLGIPVAVFGIYYILVFVI